MLSKFRWLGLASLAVLVVTAVIGAGTNTGRSQVQPPERTAPFDLTGRWKSDTGQTIVIRHDRSGQVTARFSPVVPCWDQTRSEYFSAPLISTGSGEGASYKLEGTYTACTNTKKMIDDCGVQKVFQTKFKADVSPDGKTISGASFRPGYAFEIENGRYVNCRRSSNYDGWQDFVLTREAEPTPSPTPTPPDPPEPPEEEPTPSPTPTPQSAFCQNVPPKTADDDREIVRMIDKLEKEIAAAERMAESFEAKANARDKAAVRSAKFYRTKAAELTKLKEYWTKVRLAQCIPPEIIQLLKMVLDGRTELCPRLCDRTADWIRRMTPGPEGLVQKNEFLMLCNRYCA